MLRNVILVIKYYIHSVQSIFKKGSTGGIKCDILFKRNLETNRSIERKYCNG